MASKKKNTPKKTQRWHLGLFKSAADDQPIVLYARTDGTVSKFYAKKVASKQALFHASYVDMSYAEARAKLLKDAKANGGKSKKVLADAAAMVKSAGRMAGEVASRRATEARVKAETASA